VRKLLTDQELNANAQGGRRKWAPLHRACHLVEDLPTAEAIVALLLKAGAKPDARNAEDKTPLFYAAGRAWASGCAMLLRAGASAAAADCAQNTPLHFAASAAAAQALLDGKAKVNAKNKEVIMAARVLMA
jgi:ankyrin repeat protein